MKKHYFGIGLIYCILALLIFAAVTAFFTVKNVNEVNSRVGHKVDDAKTYMDYCTAEEDPEEIINSALRSWKQCSEAGIYSALIDKENGYSVILEADDFMEVYSLGKDFTPSEARYLIIPDTVSLSNEDVADNEFKGFNENFISNAYCDKVFIYDGVLRLKVNGKDKVVDIGRPAPVNEAEGVPFEEWQSNPIYYYGAIYSFGNTSMDNKLNAEAREKAEEYIKKYRNGPCATDITTEKGFFVSTSCAISEVGHGKYAVVYYQVCRPFQTALTENYKTYIVIGVLWLFIEAAIIGSFCMLYRNQKEYEIRSQRLTRGIAHELKTPLAVTRACVENWEYLDEEQRPEYSKKIITEVDHMSEMINRLLDLSRINGGNVKLNQESVDLLLLSKTVKNRHEALIRERNIEFKINREESNTVYPVYADLDMMSIVLNNFISNAIKFCDHSVKIKLSRVGRKIEFTITNDGATIGKSEQKKIWDIFYKTDEARTQRFGSSGVGLAVVKSILDMHRAKYGCFSDENGTVFWFTMDAYGPSR